MITTVCLEFSSQYKFIDTLNVYAIILNLSLSLSIWTIAAIGHIFACVEITKFLYEPVAVRSLTRQSETGITREPGLRILEGSETHSGRDSS
jgi:hypothetical protein